MKHYYFGLLTAMTSLLFIVSCTKNQNDKVSDIILNPTELDLAVGSSRTISAVLMPADVFDKITWTSSDSQVATVSENGTVEAVKSGNAVITASVGDVKSECNVTVASAIDNIVLNKKELFLVNREYFQLKIIYPDDATVENITWTSSDESVVSVKDGLVSANAIGKAVITAADRFGDAKDECEVTVVPKTGELSITPSEVSVEKGETVMLHAVFTPEDVDDNHVVWTTSDEYVASVSENGEVSGVAIGNVIITATATNGVSATCNVTVTGKAAIGDYFYSDGTCSVTPNPNKTIVGIVFWTGDPTEEDSFLKKEHPECTHGLVVGLKDISCSWSEYSHSEMVGTWISLHTEYPSPTTTGYDSKMTVINGYSLTKGLVEYNTNSRSHELEFVSKLGFYKENNPEAEGTSGWFIPSAREYELLSDGTNRNYSGWYKGIIRDMISGKLENIGSDPFRFVYWSCLEFNESMAFLYTLGHQGPKPDVDPKTATHSVRYIFAF